MAPTHYTKYRLSPGELHSTFHAALTRSKELRAEAAILYQQKFFRGAATWFTLALEEIGKAYITWTYGALYIGRALEDWSQFWKQYYSHQAKLEAAYIWLRRDQVSAFSSLAELDSLFAHAIAEARRLDSQKQDATYSNPVTRSIELVTPPTYEVEADQLRLLVDAAIRDFDEHRISIADTKTFEDLLVRATMNARRMGLVPSSSAVFFDTDAAHAPVYRLQLNAHGADSELPPLEIVENRVVEKYGLLPLLLPATLRQVNRSKRYRKFYRQLQSMCQYPEWMVASVLYDIVRNTRYPFSEDPKSRSTPPFTTNNGVFAWFEPVDAEELDESVLTDLQLFDEAMDMWFYAFFAGLGVYLIPETSMRSKMIRRVAFRAYGLFQLDPPHTPLFHFKDLRR